MNNPLSRPTAASDSPQARRGRIPPLASPWSLAQRCAEECAREGEPSFALLVVEPIPHGSSQERFPDVLRNDLRRADTIAEIGSGRFAVLMSAAGGYDAGRLASRIRRSTDAIVGVAVFPQDGVDLGELVMAALATMRASLDAAS